VEVLEQVRQALGLLEVLAVVEHIVMLRSPQAMLATLLLLAQVKEILVVMEAGLLIQMLLVVVVVALVLLEETVNSHRVL
jgi:hypothetical protein